LRASWSWSAIGVVVASGALLGAACAGGEEATPAKGTATSAATSATKASPTTAATPAATTKAAATTAPAATGSPKAAATPGATTPTTALRVGDTSLGKVIVDNNGFTLYTFKNDPPNGDKSACNGNCASIWPPAFAPATGEPQKAAEATGTVKIITRDDGTKQIAYNGLPLYRYQPDTAPGEVKGEGVGGNWNVARP
jgi:predicted lipoprotein with Yx(FWY)xxD motif